MGWGIQTETTDDRTRVFLNPVGHRGLQVSIALSGEREEAGPGAAIGGKGNWGSQMGLEGGSVSCQDAQHQSQ